MICDECKKRPATVHFTKIINGHKTEMHLCQECAREKGDFDFFTIPEFSFQNFLAGLLQGGGSYMGLPTVPEGDTGIRISSTKTCENCGLDYPSFMKSGFLGCSVCYSQFASQLEPILRKIHGATRHVGKVPRKTGGTLRIRREIEELRAQLQRHIAKEEYEKAAEIRDKIHAMEKQLEK